MSELLLTIDRPLRSAQLGSIKAYGLVACVVLAALGIAIYVLVGGPREPAAPSAPPVRDLTTMSRDDVERLRALRDEALDCMGWAAGNAFRRRNWPAVESYVGQRGLYYDQMLELTPPGLASDLREAERGGNLSRYQEAFVRGRQASFNEAEVTRCVERTREISDELESLLAENREPASLGSPVSPE